MWNRKVRESDYWVIHVTVVKVTSETNFIKPGLVHFLQNQTRNIVSSWKHPRRESKGFWIKKPQKITKFQILFFFRPQLKYLAKIVAAAPVSSHSLSFCWGLGAKSIDVTTTWSRTHGRPSLPHRSGRAVANLSLRMNTKEQRVKSATVLPERWGSLRSPSVSLHVVVTVNFCAREQKPMFCVVTSQSPSSIWRTSIPLPSKSFPNFGRSLFFQIAAWFQF